MKDISFKFKGVDLQYSILMTLYLFKIERDQILNFLRIQLAKETKPVGN